MNYLSFLIINIFFLNIAISSEKITYKEQYQQHISECDQNLSTQIISPSKQVGSEPSRLNCHQKAILAMMLQQPERRELILIAILNSASERVTETVKTVIDFGMAPMVVMNRAMEILPEHNDDIAKGAEMAGVDSIVVIEATTIIVN